MIVANVPRAEPSPPAHALAALLAERRSVRRLRAGPLRPGALERIAESARRVPAAYDRPSWHVVVVHGRRDAFWDVVEAAFRDRLTGERQARYLDRLGGFRTGIGAVLVYEDRAAVAAMEAAAGIGPDRARAFSEQALGMVQLALWLAVVAEGLAASLQHWESLVEDRVADVLGLPPDRFRLVAAMPVGYPAEEPPAGQRPSPRHVVSVDAYAEGGDHPDPA